MNFAANLPLLVRRRRSNDKSIMDTNDQTGRLTSNTRESVVIFKRSRR